MSVLLNTAKYSALLAGASSLKKPLDRNKNFQNPFLSSVASGSLSSFALSTIPLDPSKPSHSRSLVPVRASSPKFGKVLCKTAQGTVFIATYDQIKKHVSEGGSPLTPRIQVILGAGYGGLSAGVLNTFKFPLEITHRIAPIFQKPGAHLSLKETGSLLKKLPPRLFLQAWRQSYNRPMVSGALAGVLVEGTRQLLKA